MGQSTQDMRSCVHVMCIHVCNACDASACTCVCVCAYSMRSCACMCECMQLAVM